MLADAPAAVMAIDRTATVSLETDRLTRFTASGPLFCGYHGTPTRLVGCDASTVVDSILSFWGYANYPDTWSIHSDTRAMYDASGSKYGVGSSAAVFVATYHALARALGRPTSLNEVMDIHRLWQGSSGSGLDVASAWHGGVIRFQSGAATSFYWPQNWHFRVIWSGSSTSTSTQLRHFSSWRENADTTTFNELCQCAHSVFESLHDEDAAGSMAALSAYSDALFRFDGAAGLSIYTEPHMTLRENAAHHAVIYKPCGAGGGDIGIAISDNAPRLEAFCRQVEAGPFTVLPTEIAAHGVHTQE